MFIKRLLVIILLGISANIYAQINTYAFPDHFNKNYEDYSALIPGTTCLPDRIILKVNNEFRASCFDDHIEVPVIMHTLGLVKLVSVQKLYPRLQAPAAKFDSYGRPMADLSLIYEITYSGSLDVRKLVAELNSLDAVEYAQPRFIEQPMYSPNDTSLSLQWYLDKIGAKNAWDLDTGDASVVVGVVDGGTNFSHPDLGGNVAYSLTDPVDGIDNDNDGFIDNYRGWDVGDMDNNPQIIGPHNSAHGSAMCGLVAATPNNIAGVAGVGYGIHYMAIKMVHTVYGFIAGYEGIVYGANHGVKVINCSWGGNSYGPYGQDVINYAVINKGVLVIAAAGNSNNTVPFYPAAYDHVIAIGGTMINDVKSGNSSYYEMVDMVSPGQGLFEPYSTGYAYGNGTSDASALTSGAAGLVQSYHDAYLPVQIGAILRQTATRIDTVPGNALYANKQGSGRLDVYRAFTASFKPFIEFNNRTYKDGNDNVIMVGDTVAVSGNMLNLLDTSTALLSATISDNSPYLQWIDSTITLGVINSMDFANTDTNPFRFRILPGCPVNQSVLIKLVFDDNGILNTQYFTVSINRNYYHIQANQLRTTVTTTGRIGFADNASLNGVGYRMAGKENNLLGIYFNPMGLFIAKTAASVSDQTLSSFLGGCCPFNNDADMVATGNILVNNNSIIADQEITSSFNDSGAGANAVGVDVKQKVYAWSDPLNDQFLVVEYQFMNNTGAAIGNWYAGMYGDFDMPDSLLWNVNSNKAFFDTVSQTAIIQHIAPRYFIGYKMLYSSGPVKYYANNTDGSGGTINVADGFSSAEKFGMMNPVSPSNASLVNDVGHYLGTSFDSLAAEGCANMYMALLIGNSLTDIRNQAAQADLKFNAVFNIWTGNAGNNNWHDPGNWSQLSIPDLSDHVLIPDTRSGSGFWPVISATGAEVKNIEIRCGGKLEVLPPFKLRVGI